jgi:uncharacterized membrane protein
MTSPGTIERSPGPPLGFVGAVSNSPPRPCLKAIIHRLAVNLWIACVVPALLFYVTLVTLNVSAAVVLALAWTYGAIAWRWATNRPLSGLLVLTVGIMTVRTVIALATGDTFLYFFQPVVSDGVIAAGFLLSLATARPVVARLAADFYPMDPDVATRPRVRRLFWHLTLMWALVCLVKGAVSFWLLQSQSLVNFVLIKNISLISMTILAVAATVGASVLVARKEGLLAAA